RRLMRVAPSPPLLNWVLIAFDCSGMDWRMSPMDGRPEDSIWVRFSTVTGAAVVSSTRGMREPVTTISSTYSSSPGFFGFAVSAAGVAGAAGLASAGASAGGAAGAVGPSCAQAPNETTARARNALRMFNIDLRPPVPRGDSSRERECPWNLRANETHEPGWRHSSNRAGRQRLGAHAGTGLGGASTRGPFAAPGPGKHRRTWKPPPRQVKSP